MKINNDEQRARGIDLFIQRNVIPNHSGSNIYTLKQRHVDNPFWIGGTRHLCPKCKCNADVYQSHKICQLCKVTFIWL